MNIFKRTVLPLFIAMFCLMNSTKVMAATDQNLNDHQKATILIAAFTANGNMPKLATALNKGMDVGLTINEVKEILIHTYAYAGFPCALNGINAYMDVLDKRKTQGITDTIGKEATPIPSDFDKTAYGHKVRNLLVGRDISKRTSGYSVFTPVIDQFLVEHLFADIFVRDVLSHQTRELLTISILASMPGTDPQLKGHLEIAMRMGLSQSQLNDFVSVLRQDVDIESAERASKTLNELFGASPRGNSSKSVKVIKKGQPTKGPKDYFTGDVDVESLFSSEIEDSYRGGIVNFEAGARTAWHTHPLGQTLIVISGRGLVQSNKDSVQEILPGDVVWIPENVRHWHGAAPDSPMSHVAISTPHNGSTVEWMEHVKTNSTAQ